MERVTTLLEPPMTVEAHRCPVCEGRGIVPGSFYTGLPILADEPCRACDASGVVWWGPEDEEPADGSAGQVLSGPPPYEDPRDPD
jgi:hypothetical protein